MSGLFGGSSAPSASPVTTLRLQTSTRGRPIPLAYGKPRLAANLIWYGDLIATGHQQSNGGKGGGGSAGTNYTYAAALIMGLCEGSINGIPRVWRQKEVFTGSAGVATVRSQDAAYLVPAGLAIAVVNAAAFVANVTVETDNGSGMTSRTILTLGVDYTRSGGTYTFAAGMVGKYVYITYDYTGASMPQDACSLLGLAAVTGTYVQTAPGWMSTKHPTEALAYRGLALVSASTYPLSDQADLTNHSFEIDTQFGYSAAIRDANPKDVLVDLLTNPYYGAGFPAAKLGDSSLYSAFCVANNIFVSPTYLEQTPVREMLSTLMLITNAGVLYSGGVLKFAPFGDVAATANGVTFTPNITPVYDLTDDDFLGEADSDPIKVTRKPNSDAYNSVRVKFYNRANNYNEEIVEAKDQASIELYGLRAKDVMDVKELCDAAAARSVAQLVLQRELYIRNEFEFTLGWSKALLEPMDLVTLTDTLLGMSQVPARILQIEEDEFGSLSVKAEEFPNNVCNAATYNTQPPIGYASNYNAAPGSTALQVLFEVPIELATSADHLDVWCAAAGGVDYGGCEVWVSLDNATYRRAGAINGNSRCGVLTGGVAAQGAPGIAAQTMSVVLAGAGQLLSGTLTDATVLNTLCVINGEFMAYQNATLTGTNAYDLATWNRGAYRSGQPVHSIGENFVRLDDNITKIALTKDYIGKTIYVKFRAFNAFGGGLQALSAVTAVSIAITGRFLKIAPADVQSLSMIVKADGARQFTFNADLASKDTANGGGYRLKYRVAGSGTPWVSMTQLHSGLLKSSPYETHAPANGVYDFGIEAVDSFGNESVNAALYSNVIVGAVDFVDAKTVTGAASDAMMQAIATLNAKIAGDAAATAQANAAAAQLAAGAAQVAADAANISIGNITSDNILSPSEKPTAVQDYAIITGDQAGLDAQGTSYALATEKTAYDSAITALTTYLGTVAGWNTIPGADVVVVGTTFRAKFAAVFSAKQVLLNAIVAKAKVLADAAQATAIASASTATWAGIVGVSGTINTGNVSGIVGAGAIGTSFIADNAATDIQLPSSTGISVNKRGSSPTANSDFTTLASYTFTPLVTGLVLCTFTSNLAFVSNATTVTYFDVPLVRVYLSGSTYVASEDFEANSRTGDMMGINSVCTANFVGKKILSVTAGVATTIIFGMVARCQASYTQTANANFLHIEVIKK
jgi:hypothetical protein